MPIQFNTLLAQAGLDPGNVYLLRHEDARVPGGIFSAWLSERKKFEAYQQGQKWKNRFPIGSSLASFVVTPERETLFVGIYDVLDVSRRTGPFVDELLGSMPAEDRAWHETQHSDRMLEYEGKLVVDWGPGHLAWRQRAANQNKEVLLRSRVEEALPFPGTSKLKCRLGAIYRPWKMHLERERGVYLLAFEDGVQYVGSASGERGFWQRWENYLANGHGGNRVLIRDRRDARIATVSILETSGSRETRNDIVRREMFWQEVLGSRAKALDELDS